jgi:hypothetical protein
MKHVKVLSVAVAATMCGANAWAQVNCAQTFGPTADAFPAELAQCLPALSLPVDPDAPTDTAFVNNLFAPGTPPNPPIGIHSHVLNAFPGSLTFRGPTPRRTRWTTTPPRPRCSVRW